MTFQLQRFILNQLNRLKFKWLTLETPYRFYVVAAALAIFSPMRIYLAPEASLAFDITLSISALLFGFGFVLWIKPWLQDKWQTSHGKLLLAGIHAVILFFAVIASRYLVANALGLPPQDFESTVHVFAIALYPALWLLLLASVLLVVSLAFFLLAFFCILSTYPLLNTPLLLISKLLSTQSKIRLFMELGRNQFSSNAVGHFMGAIFIALPAAGAGALHAKFLLENPAFIRWIAYATDFHEAKNFLGVDRTKKLRLHENGVVSYAEKNGEDIKITIGRFND
jgi:hypothetical protein